MKYNSPKILNKLFQNFLKSNQIEQLFNSNEMNILFGYYDVFNVEQHDGSIVIDNVSSIKLNAKNNQPINKHLMSSLNVIEYLNELESNINSFNYPTHLVEYRTNILHFSLKITNAFKTDLSFLKDKNKMSLLIRFIIFIVKTNIQINKVNILSEDYTTNVFKDINLIEDKIKSLLDNKHLNNNVVLPLFNLVHNYVVSFDYDENDNKINKYIDIYDDEELINEDDFVISVAGS